MKCITTAPLHAALALIALGLDQGRGVVNAKKKTPHQIATFWTPLQRQSVVSRDITFDPFSGDASVREPNGEMGPYTWRRPPLQHDHPNNDADGRNLRGSDDGGSPSDDFGSRFGSSNTPRPRNRRQFPPAASEGGRHQPEGGRELTSIVQNDDVEFPTPSGLQAVGRLFFCFIIGSVEKCYSCSGTVASNNMIITAAHCVYDVTNEIFAQNIMFIPNQDDGGIDPSDFNCSNDMYGCWFPDHIVINAGFDTQWYYYDLAAIVFKTGDGIMSHESVDGWDDRPMSDFVCPFSIDFNQIGFVEGEEYGTSYGYPGVAQDFRYCQGTVDGTDIRGLPIAWMNECTMGKGSSGGPWVPSGTTDIYATNSFKYCPSDEPVCRDGMGATPCYNDGRCQCVIDAARSSTENMKVNSAQCPFNRFESSGAACPSGTPTSQPTQNPTTSPSQGEVTPQPTTSPSQNPVTSQPTKGPTSPPDESPDTSQPTQAPSQSPTSSATPEPSVTLTKSPTKTPTDAPTDAPTGSTIAPEPTNEPSISPTKSTSDSPIVATTDAPTNSPTHEPTTEPSIPPTNIGPLTSPPTKSNIAVEDRPENSRSASADVSEQPTSSPTDMHLCTCRPKKKRKKKKQKKNKNKKYDIVRSSSKSCKKRPRCRSWSAADGIPEFLESSEFVGLLP